MPPWNVLRDLLLYAVLPAVGLAAFVSLLLRGLLGPAARHAATALALLAGFAVANSLDPQLPWAPEKPRWTWTLLALLVVVVVEASLGSFRWAWLLRLLASGVVAWLLIPGVLAPVVFGIVVFAGWQLLETVLRDLPGMAAPLLLSFVLCGGAATVMIHAHTARYTQALVYLASALLGVALAGARIPDDGRGSAGPVVLLLAALSYFGWTGTTSEVPEASFFLVGLAPLAAGLALVPGLRREPGWGRVVLLAALLAIPILVAVGLAVSHESMMVG